MTVLNKKSAPVKFDQSRHYSPKDTVEIIPKQSLADKGCSSYWRPAVWDTCGNLKVLRLRSNPNEGEWVS